MNSLLKLLGKIYQVYAFFCAIGVTLVFIFAVDIPVYGDEPFTDGNGITWIEDKGVMHGYQIVDSKSEIYHLKVYELDDNKKQKVVADAKFKINLPLAAPLTAGDFSLYDGKHINLRSRLSLIK
jgi:hypothetical protein